MSKGVAQSAVDMKSSYSRHFALSCTVSCYLCLSTFAPGLDIAPPVSSIFVVRRSSLYFITPAIKSVFYCTKCPFSHPDCCIKLQLLSVLVMHGVRGVAQCLDISHPRRVDPAISPGVIPGILTALLRSGWAGTQQLWDLLGCDPLRNDDHVICHKYRLLTRQCARWCN